MKRMTFKEIGRVLGISQQSAEEIYRIALRKLSSPKNLKKWQEILDTIKEIEKEKAKSDSNTLDFEV